MHVETLYISRDTLEALLSDRRVSTMSLSSSGGRGLLSLQVKAGSVDGIAAAAGETRIDLLVSPSCLTLRWTGEDGLCQQAHFPAEDGAANLEDLVTQPLRLPQLARSLTLLQASAEPQDPDPAAPRFQRETILMLLRHAAVSDLLFGSDGREATLQFQVLNGYAGVDERPPQDWVGIDFTEAGADLSWFDQGGLFQMRALTTARDERALRALCLDPLGCVLWAGKRGRTGLEAVGANALIDRLRETFPSEFSLPKSGSSASFTV